MLLLITMERYDKNLISVRMMLERIQTTTVAIRKERKQHGLHVFNQP
jgi:hypothetical protein